MPLIGSETTLTNSILSNLQAAGFDYATSEHSKMEEFVNAISNAIISHITTNALVTGTDSGGDTISSAVIV